MAPGSEDFRFERTNHGLLPVPGGVSLFINDIFFASVGVCGGSGAQDIEATYAGIAAIGVSLRP
jgi:uncharacterized protein GlcG (DUF336 family)